MSLKKIFFALVLVISFVIKTNAQERLSYVDSTGTVIDFPSDSSSFPFHSSYIVYGFGVRFNLPMNYGIIDSVDFVIDTLGTDPLFVSLVKDTILTIGTGPQHLPNFFSTKPFAQVTVPVESIIPGSRTHVYLNKVAVPDSFFCYYL